ncbi:MAG TPA: hypothetical protein VGM86_26855 [Thermoanaerobaculia bacterium]
MSAPHAPGFLLMRRAGGLWGIANGAVEGLARDGAGYRIQAGGAALAADEILGVVTDLRVVPAAPALRRFWPEEPAGVAVHAGVPLVVVDPRRLPAALRCEIPRCDAGEDEEQGHE